MKNLLLYIILTLSFGVFGQTNGHQTAVVNNSQNFELSPFAKLKLTQPVHDYDFEVSLSKVALMRYDGTDEAETIGLEKDNLDTAMYFKITGDNSKQYYYPINSKKFNWMHYANNIGLYSSNIEKVQISVAIYNMGEVPIIIVEKLRKLKR